MECRDGEGDMTDCRYMVDSRCTSRLALPLYGSRPSAGVCAECEFRNGPRGLGDLVALMISYTPFRMMQKAGCGGCKQRQEALNKAAPIRRCGCADRAAQADERKESTS